MSGTLEAGGIVTGAVTDWSLPPESHIHESLHEIVVWSQTAFACEILPNPATEELLSVHCPSAFTAVPCQVRSEAAYYC